MRKKGLEKKSLLKVLLYKVRGGEGEDQEKEILCISYVMLCYYIGK